MKTKDLIEKIRSEVPDCVYDGSTEDVEIKKALYVYIELAKNKSFDERYYLANGQLAKRIVKQAYEDSKSENFERTLKKKKLICVSMANTYSRILNILGIDCQPYRLGNSDHLYNIITLRNGKRFYADVQLDLYRIQTGRKINHFYSLEDEDALPEDRLVEMLKQLGYTKDKESYNDRENKILALRSKVEGSSPDDALKIILGADELFTGLKNLETSEAYSYYYSLRKDILDKKTFKKTYQFSCAKLDEKGEPKDFTFCIYPDTYDYRTVTPYLYSKKQGRMLPCNLETLDRLQSEGLKLGRLGIETRVGRLRKYMKQAVKESKRKKEKER